MSRFFSLSLRDFAKGSIVALLTGIGTFLAQELQGDVVFSIKQILLSAAIAWIAYLVKNLFTNNHDEVLKPDR